VSNTLPAPCDALTARTKDGTNPPAYPRLVIATAILASSLALIDSSVVNVGLPAISRSFDADAAGLQWVVNAYLLPLSALLLLGGAVGDRFGRRRLLIAGVVLFCIASLACSVAPTLPFLQFARFVQGASAAMLMPNSLAILGQSFHGEAKGRAIGIWAATGAAAGAVGPVLGGWLIDAGSWRLAFLINVPVSVAAVMLAYRFVDRDVDEANGVLDWSGGALATAGLGFITWALTEGSGRSWSPSIFVSLVVGIAFSITFLLAERRRGEKAMMPLSLFGSTSFVGLTLLTFLLYGALGGLFVLLPYVLIQAGNYTATQAGAALLPLPLIIAMASPAAGALAAKIGPRSLLVTGPIIVAVGFLLMLRVGSSTSYWLYAFPAMTVIAIGMAGAVAPLTTAVLMSVDSYHTGAASGLNSAVARTGGLVVTALIGPVIASSGAALISAFEVAAMIGAVISVLAAASAVLVRPTGAVI
jgi:EmrB/QacA subfamily drug resistance transporter